MPILKKLSEIIGWIVIAFALVSIFTPSIVQNIPTAEARAARRYLWCERIPINSVTYVDTTFPTEWESVSLLTDSSDALLRFAGISDTTSFSSRTLYKLRDGDVLDFGSADKLKRISIRSSILAVDTLFLIGYKDTPQY